VTAERGHLAHLLHAGADCLFAGIEVTHAEEGAAAAALTVWWVGAGRNAASPGLVLLVDEGAVLHVNGEVVPLGDAVLARADLFAGAAYLTMLLTEGAAAVDAQSYRPDFTARELAEEAFLYFALLGVYVWH
jgi:hypothetical protein